VPTAARVVVNPDPDRGQLSSLQTALAVLPVDATGFAFTPVDSPAVDEETVGGLVRTFEERDPSTMFVIPRQDGRRGHPVLAAREIAAEFLALPPTSPASDVVHRFVDRTQYVDVDDAGIFTDIDDPAAYQLLTRRLV
jgi:molybdenum cofactor cytidylyltransferase